MILMAVCVTWSEASVYSSAPWDGACTLALLEGRRREHCRSSSPACDA
jgi:hypothetical protein